LKHQNNAFDGRKARKGEMENKCFDKKPIKLNELKTTPKDTLRIFNQDIEALDDKAYGGEGWVLSILRYIHI